jgi:hypothetical protein
MSDAGSFCENLGITATGKHLICLISLSAFSAQLYSEELCIVRDLWKMHNF